MKLPPLDSEAFLNLPALAPPPGVTPQFINPPSLRAPGLAILQLVISTLMVCMRLYTKRFIVRKVLSEDWWLLASWVAFACFHVMVFMMENLPLGVHQWDITIRDAIKQSKLFNISTAIYCLVALPLKVAIILQIRRIVLPCQRQQSTAQHIYRWTIDFFLALNVIFYTILFIFQFVACRPLAKSWDVRITTGHCVSHRLVVHVVSASINTLSDCMTVLLPQPVIWKLKIGKGKKAGLSAVFAIGTLACVASAIRLFYAVRLLHSTDLTFAAGIMGKWIEPELALGFIAACLPVLPQFIRTLARTEVGRKLGLSSLPSNKGTSASNGYQSRGTPLNLTVGSREIRKQVDMDVEFAELTRTSEERAENLEERLKKGEPFRFEEWHDDAEIHTPQQAHMRRLV